MANGQFGFAVDVPGAVQRGLQFRQAEQMRPLQQQQAQLELQRQQQQFATGGLQQQDLQQQIQQRTEEQKNKSLVNTALRVTQLSDEEMIPFLQKQIETVKAQGGDASESESALQLAQAGDFAGVRKGAQDVINIGVRQGLITPEQEKAAAPFQKAEKGLVFNPNTGTFSVDPVAKQRLEQVAEQASATGKLEFKDRQSLNKDVTGIIKNTVGIANTAKDLGKLSKIKSGPSSIALVFKFMKALDPNSVVREGEFATAQNSAGIPESISNIYNKLMKGERLGDVQIGQFVETAEALADEAIESSNQEVGSLLNTFGDTIDDKFKSNIMGRIPKRFKKKEEPGQKPATEQPAQEIPEGTVIVNKSTGQRMRLVGGNWEAL